MISVSNLTVIDVMVDPDGTLDALSSMGLTSPLVPDQGTSPGGQQEATAPHPSGTAEGLSDAQSATGADGSSKEPSGPSEAPERDPGLHVNNNLAASGQQSSGPHN